VYIEYLHIKGVISEMLTHEEFTIHINSSQVPSCQQ